MRACRAWVALCLCTLVTHCVRWRTVVPSGFTMASTVAVWLMMTAEWSENVTCTSPSGRTTKRTRLGDSDMRFVVSWAWREKGFLPADRPPARFLEKIR